MKLVPFLVATSLLPSTAQAQPSAVTVPSSRVISAKEAENETAKALIAIVPEIITEPDPNRKNTVLLGIARALAGLGREKEAMAVPADKWQREEIPHLVGLSKLYSGDLDGARASIPHVKRAYSRADLMFAISREYIKRKQPKQALPLIREAQRLMDRGQTGEVYKGVGVLLMQCGDKAGAWQAFQKARVATEAQEKHFWQQPARDIYSSLVSDMLEAGFTEQALQLAAKDQRTPSEAATILVNKGAAERAIQFAASLKPRGQATYALARLTLDLIEKGQSQNARRALNLSREKAKSSFDEANAMRLIASWVFGYCRLGDLNTAKAVVAKVPELQKAPRFEFNLLMEAAVSPLKDTAIEAKRTIWLQRVADQLNALPAVSPSRFEAMRVAEFLLDRGRKNEAMPFLEIADSSLKNIVDDTRAVSHVQAAVIWRRVGNLERAKERAQTAVTLAEGLNAWVAQRQLEAANFTDEAIAVLEKRIAEPRKDEFEWGNIAAEQSSLRPAPPADWIQDLKDPVVRAIALTGWASGLSQRPEAFFMSGGRLISP